MCKIEQELYKSLNKMEMDIMADVDKAVSVEGKKSLQKIDGYKTIMYNAMCDEAEESKPRAAKGEALGKGIKSLMEQAEQELEAGEEPNV